MKKFKKIATKYFPDLIILFGIYLFSYNLLRPPGLSIDLFDHTDEKVLGIMLVVLGVNILLRRYFNKKE